MQIGDNLHEISDPVFREKNQKKCPSKALFSNEFPQQGISNEYPQQGISSEYPQYMVLCENLEKY